MGSHEILATTPELLDLPHERRLVRGILHTPRRCLPRKTRSNDSHWREKNGARTLNFGVSASSGTGTQTSTLLAVLRRLNCALHFTMYSTRDPLWLSTAASTHMSGFTGVESL